MKILLQAVLAQVAVLRGLAETTCLPNATRASDRRELVNLLAGESCGFQNGIPKSSASCRILPRVHVICDSHFLFKKLWQILTDSSKKILKCPSVLRDLQSSDKMVVSFLWRRGESYPIGLWRNADYAAAKLMARVVQIVIQAGDWMETIQAVEGCFLEPNGTAFGVFWRVLELAVYNTKRYIYIVYTVHSWHIIW